MRGWSNQAVRLARNRALLTSAWLAVAAAGLLPGMTVPGIPRDDAGHS